MPIKTFRGMIADGAQDTILLHTNNGSIGYRIVKFDIISSITGSAAASTDHLVKVWKVTQTSVPTTGATIDVSDQTLLAVANLTMSVSSSSGLVGSMEKIIFEREIFNQDIYVTHTDNDGTDACNYYIELEQIKLDLSENTVATLKDIRNQA
jgi:hypothetical protein